MKQFHKQLGIMNTGIPSTVEKNQSILPTESTGYKDFISKTSMSMILDFLEIIQND